MTPDRHPAKRLQVGLAWSGDGRHMRDHLRSIPADMVLRLADLPGIGFQSLQHTVRTHDRPALEVRPAVRRDVENAADFADTAALIARLDLVITVDTAIAHLAGALGKPVWILLHVAPDWRWLTNRDRQPLVPDRSAVPGRTRGVGGERHLFNRGSGRRLGTRAASGGRRTTKVRCRLISRGSSGPAGGRRTDEHGNVRLPGRHVRPCLRATDSPAPPAPVAWRPSRRRG